jgi:hypothetical protein
MGTISGVVYLKAGEIPFPEERWTDLIVCVLTEWLDTVLRIARGSSWEERFHFLDGPFAVDLVLMERGAIRARFIECRLTGDIVTHESDTDSESLLNNACEIADHVLFECDRLGWSSPNLDSLAEVRRDLTRARSRHGLQ